MEMRREKIETKTKNEMMRDIDILEKIVSESVWRMSADEEDRVKNCKAEILMVRKEDKVLRSWADQKTWSRS